MRPAAFVDFRCISLDPAPDTTGVHWDAAFGHQLGHVFISQGVWEVPTDALHDHLTGEMAAFEGIGGRDRHAPPQYQTPPPNFATEPFRAPAVLIEWDDGEQSEIWPNEAPDLEERLQREPEEGSGSS